MVAELFLIAVLVAVCIKVVVQGLTTGIYDLIEGLIFFAALIFLAEVARIMALAITEQLTHCI